MDCKDLNEEQLFSDSDTDSNSEPFKAPVATLIIGKAGIGKSTYLLKNYSDEEYLLTAFTGIAAARIGAKTISSIFALGPECDREITLSSSIMYRQKTHLLLRKKKGIVIDEYYTLPQDVMDKVDELLQIMRQCPLPFGGMEVVLIGDNRQTAAVGDAFVRSPLYKSMTFEKIVLPYHKKMRLKPRYMKFCNKFRNPKLTAKEMIELLKDERFAQEEVPGYTVYHQNKYVNERNEREMKRMTTEVVGVFDKVEYKKGCPISITKNGPGVYNGMLGILQGYDSEKKELEIEFDDHILETTRRGVEFVPAHAMSIHKSQSNTFPGINIYLDSRKIVRYRNDSIRLIYTALTRVRNFDKCFIGWL